MTYDRIMIFCICFYSAVKDKLYLYGGKDCLLAKECLQGLYVLDTGELHSILKLGNHVWFGHLPDIIIYMMTTLFCLKAGSYRNDYERIKLKTG